MSSWGTEPLLGTLYVYGWQPEGRREKSRLSGRGALKAPQSTLGMNGFRSSRGLPSDTQHKQGSGASRWALVSWAS